MVHLGLKGEYCRLARHHNCSLIAVSQTLVWIMAVADAIVTYSQAHRLVTPFNHFSPTFLRLQQEVGTNALLAPSIPMFFGTCIVASASILRLWCYSKLGQLFTFEVTIDPQHSLVTSGPYSVVRHPSYTGVFLTLIGSTIVGFSPGSYLRERWISSWLGGEVSQELRNAGSGTVSLGWVVQTSVLTLVTIWFAIMIYAARGTIKRLQVEDQQLRRIFGRKWEMWAEKVRWRLVPGLY